MDASIILGGHIPDFVNVLDQSNMAAQRKVEFGRQNALADLYRTQGAQIMAGDQNALNALAGFDPAAAMGLQQTRQQMAYSTEEMQMKRDQVRLEAQDRVRQLATEEAEALRANTERAIAAASQAKDAATWDATVTQLGIPELVGKFAERDILIAQALGLKDALEMAKPKDGDIGERYRNVDGIGLVDLAAEGGPKPVDLGTPPPTVGTKGIDDLRKEFSGLAPVKTFAVQTDAYSRIAASAQDPSAAGDLALIFSYMKMLDPGSVVREGEFANAQNAAGVPERIQAMYNNVLTGERLTPETRMDFLTRAEKIYSGAKREYQNVREQYEGIAIDRGYPINQALIDFSYTGPSILPPPAPSAPQPAPSAPPPQAPTIIDGFQIEALD